MKYIVAFLLACLLAVPADATGCRVVVKKEVAVNKVIVEKVAAVAVPVVAVATVPYYASYYQPVAPVAPAPQAGIADNGELTNAIKELIRRIDALERRGTQPPTMPPADPPAPGKPTNPFEPQGAAPLRQNFAASCVQCHKPGGAGTGPQGITLFDARGEWIPGTEGRAMASVYGGRMPKGGKLTDEQVGDFMAGIDAHLKGRKP